MNIPRTTGLASGRTAGRAPVLATGPNTRPDTRPDTPPRRLPESLFGPVVVGVDGGGRSASAVAWAADEAEHNGRLLRLVNAYADFGKAREHEEPDGTELARLGRRLALSDLECRLVAGDPPEVLVGAAADASLLVVGRRGLGTAHRLVVGSTSLAVAGRSPVPVVVVPERWTQPTMASAPVVVAIDAGDLIAHPAATADEDVLRFGFARAAARRVPLIAVSAWAVPALYSWSPGDIGSCGQRYEERLDRRLAPWRELYPTVEVVARSVAGAPADAILEAAAVAQVAVIGRHADHRAHALRLGSTARQVLHHAERPVVVVPRAQAGGESSPGAPGWAPMF
jgi:nucleotide-binding universal stress UspA family protein